MRRFDFTIAGGFPFDQDVLKHMQEGYIEVLQALAGAFRNESEDVAMAITGIEFSDAGGGDIEISPGFYLWRGKVGYFEGATYTPPGGALEPFAVIYENAVSLDYFDGTSHNAKFHDIAEMELIDGGDPQSDTQFKLSLVRSARWGLAIKTLEEMTRPFATPVFAGFYVADSLSPIKYKRDYNSNTVVIKGITKSSSPSSVIANDVIFTLPSGMRPAEEQLFVVWSTTNTDHAVIRIKANGEVSLAGDLMNTSNDGVSCNVRFDVG